MSPGLISRSPDLSQLRADGYDVQTQDAFLLVREVPYLDASGNIVRGTLVKPLTLSGDVADYQGDHTIHLAGPTPHDAAGRPLNRVINSSATQVLIPGVTVDHYLSNKPPAGYRDYHDLVTTYVIALSKHAQALDPSVTARTRPVVLGDEDADSPFVYLDTASARTGVAAINAKVRGHRVAIVGLGGTGAYILDLVAKAPVCEIHLFDGDRLMQHNAFRYPGAVPLSAVAAKPMKVDYLAALYSEFRHGVVPHPYYLGEDNVEELADMDFVFLAIDDNPSRATIAARLEAADVAFIDVGMGLYVSGGTIGGQIRTTSSLRGQREHLWDSRKRLPTRTSADDVYNHNVQICDLNAFNAVLAVTRWKRHIGIYSDHGHEHHSVYVLDGNKIINEDH